MKKQTAIDWLVEQVKSKENQKSFSILQWLKIIEKAKEMEKEQIIDAYVDVGIDDNPNLPILKMVAEKYYNEKYGGDK
jgi:hypothetical protein